MPISKAELLAAYRATCYRVWLTPACSLDLRIGRTDAQLTSWLAAADGGRGAKRWLILTASNPGSVRLSDDENLARSRILESWLAAENRRYLPAENIDLKGQWPTEVGFLVAGISLRAAFVQAAAWGQNAVVYGDQTGRGRLVWLPLPPVLVKPA